MRKVLFLLVFGALALCLAGCRRTPDEQRIRAAIEVARTAAAEVDAGGLTGVLTEDFDGNGGAMATKDLGNLLRLARFRGETVHAVLGPIEVEPRGERYIARFTVTLGSGGKLFPAELGVFKVETGWRREGREWRCFTASWEQQL
ncbi:hypothetical protein ABZR86_02160 [Dyella marensis]|uniref:DUF4440 domain-containing protein n=1 Tax=Dyella marensis TaxID=500610 RepID=A0A1I2A5V5_9GAMM|nr:MULTISPECIES: hypothetical protein [Dyella]SFE39445.1 hypothetical protein SAMN02799615_00939 [Dyella marensis]